MNYLDLVLLNFVMLAGIMFTTIGCCDYYGTVVINRVFPSLMTMCFIV